MREHPIIFSTPMVQAILDASKTQTRRPIMPQPCKSTIAMVPAISGRHWIEQLPLDLRALHPESKPMTINGKSIKCPYGQIGDRLWVREAFAPALAEHGECFKYKASKNHQLYYQCGKECPEGVEAITKWKPSIHMPRWASRIDLEITEIRAERLQDISEEDAIAEGWDANNSAYSPLTWFEKLWDSINGKKYPWVNNDWVWVISFKVVK